MKVGMFTSGYQRNDIEDVFRDAKRFGYDYIEPALYAKRAIDRFKKITER